MSRRSTPPLRAWVALAGLLAGASLAVALAMAVACPGACPPAAALPAALDWQPGLEAAQPWRLWTAAWVHWSGAHLAVNLAGAGGVAWVGARAEAGRADTLAWALAWPLTHVLLSLAQAWPNAAIPGLGMDGTLQHYGGLSGVLHAGVIILGLGLAAAPAGVLHADEARRRRQVGIALCAGTLAKVLLEAPWNLALRPSALLGIDVAPVAHACGLAAGVLAWGLVRALARRR